MCKNLFRVAGRSVGRRMVGISNTTEEMEKMCEKTGNNRDAATILNSRGGPGWGFQSGISGRDGAAVLSA